MMRYDMKSQDITMALTLLLIDLTSRDKFA